MRRREFIALLGGIAVASPARSRAQQRCMRRVGVLMNLTPDDPESPLRVAALLKGLQEFGWIDGRNLQIDYRWTAADVASVRGGAAELVALAPNVILASGTPMVAVGYTEGHNVTNEYRWADNQYERLPGLAADLVNRPVNVIFANSPSIPAALAATKTIPIIFNSGDDPGRLGFVASLNRPGGNATGVAIFSNELAAKRLELMRELVPHSKSIAVLINSDFGPGALRS
jgi:ABC-type uncharacterized transport system substrate-binding protein